MVVWVGVEPLGDRDGRVALYLTEHVSLLAPRRPAGPDGQLHQQIRTHLAERGASFFAQLLQACGAGGARSSAFAPEVLDALSEPAKAVPLYRDELAI
jgi:ATP-dependent Lhr-like helicase